MSASSAARAALWSCSIAMGALACAAPGAIDVEAGGGALIGGEPADEGEFPSTVLVAHEYTSSDGAVRRYPLCTAAKVGPRHLLTAGHCLVYPDAATGDVTLLPMVEAGARLLVTNRPSVRFADAALTPVTVERAHVFPHYLAACERSPATCNRVGGAADEVPDVGLIVVREPLSGIPTARVDLRPVFLGEPLAIQGFGCRDSIRTGEDYSEVELNWARTFALPADASANRDVFRRLRPEEFRARVAPVYVLTPGPVVADDQGGLCPGDSGGPLYRQQGANDLVVGVNSSYGFALNRAGDDFVPVPLTNWHTRLDLGARYPVARWLIERGAATTFSPLLGLHLELPQCADGFKARYVAHGGVYCVDRETGEVDATMRTADMLLACYEQRAAAGEDPRTCDAPRWDEASYLARRGDRFCAQGAHFDVRLGACVSGFAVFGRPSARVRWACAAAGTPCEESMPPLTTVHRALQRGAIVPAVDCVQADADGSLTASFGYGSGAQRPLHIAAGADNRLGTRRLWRGQVADFLPGRVQGAFRARFAAGETLTWSVVGTDGVAHAATASATSRRCRL